MEFYYQVAWLHMYTPAYLPTYLPTYLPAYLLTWSIYQRGYKYVSMYMYVREAC